MNNNQQLASILEHLHEQRHDPWGYQASIIANGIRQASESYAQQPARDRAVEALHAISGELWGIGRILQRNSLTLEGIEQALRNRMATTAREFAARGLHALAQGWALEAVEQLSSSVKPDADPLNPLLQYACGVAHERVGMIDESLEHYRLAVRYTPDDASEQVAGLGLLWVQSLEEAGRLTEAGEAADEAIRRSPNCPELLLTRARLTQNTSGVRTALELAPGLAVQALAQGVPGVEWEAEAMFRDEHSVIGRALAAQHELAAHRRGTHDSTSLTVRRPKDAAEATVVAQRFIDELPAVIQQLAPEPPPTAPVKPSDSGATMMSHAREKLERMEALKRAYMSARRRGIWFILAAVLSVYVSLGVIGPENEDASVPVFVVAMVFGGLAWFVLSHLGHEPSQQDLQHARDDVARAQRNALVEANELQSYYESMEKYRAALIAHQQGELAKDELRRQLESIIPLRVMPRIPTSTRGSQASLGVA